RARGTARDLLADRDRYPPPRRVLRLLLRDRADLRGQEIDAPVRGQAQGFLVLVTYGIGMLIGAQVAGNVYNRILGGATSLTLDQWPSFWVLPAGFAAVVLVFFAVLFRPPAMAPGAGRAPGKAS